MTGIEDLASTARPVIRVENAENTPYRLLDTDTTDADDISPEGEFPQFGDFLDVLALDGNAAALGPRWLECPGGLARALVDGDLVSDDAQFQVVDASKDESGAWTFDIEGFDG
jgi:hypothetical protein